MQNLTTISPAPYVIVRLRPYLVMWSGHRHWGHLTLTRSLPNNVTFALPRTRPSWTTTWTPVQTGSFRSWWSSKEWKNQTCGRTGNHNITLCRTSMHNCGILIGMLWIGYKQAESTSMPKPTCELFWSAPESKIVVPFRRMPWSRCCQRS